MQFAFYALLSLIVLTPALPATAAASSRTHHRALSSKTSAKHTAKPKLVGQRTIDDERATQIQTALIKAGYLSGTPSGHWDAESAAAMGKVQADNGWQTKLVPDSRALIKLGLGPTSGTSLSSASSAALAAPAAGYASSSFTADLAQFNR
jgi:peptidoglycan hydrolase-like protein with peptidoglycan-binding domain